MLEGQARPRPDLRFETRRKFDRESRWHGLRNARFQECVGDGTEVHAGVFFGAVGVLGQNSVGVELANTEFHWDAGYSSMPERISRQVLAIAPMPPEKSAYALARYSRSADSIVESLQWVRTHDSSKFLESFYFQYGHASIADLGHIAMCFEGISELAAAEVEDEPLWDGQAKSSRYQDFGRSGFVTPPGFVPGWGNRPPRPPRPLGF